MRELTKTALIIVAGMVMVSTAAIAATAMKPAPVQCWTIVDRDRVLDLPGAWFLLRVARVRTDVPGCLRFSELVPVVVER